jgi:AcrR family transcriptional regulator
MKGYFPEVRARCNCSDCKEIIAAPATLQVTSFVPTKFPVESVSADKEGLRERKRRETFRRIAEIGLKLFIERGYEATTLEVIAAEAGISARTFFHYFKTKDEVLQFWQGGGGFLEAVSAALLRESTRQTPLQAVRHCLLKLLPGYDSENAVVVDRIWHSTDSLRAHKQAFFVQLEQTVFTALCELWPLPDRRPALRMIAMLSVGAMRLAIEDRRQDSRIRPLTEYLQESFAVLEDQLSPSDDRG